MERAGMQEYFSEVRAYFAPVNRVTETGTVFDPSLSFNLNNPPSPWVRLGLVRNFKRVDKSAMGIIRAGAAGVPQTQFLKALDARVSLDFCEWGKLQMALAASSQHMNVLQSAGTQPRASGGAATPGQPILAGSTAALILLDPSVLGNYQVGELIVVDVDYASGATELGTGITGGVAGAGAAARNNGRRRDTPGELQRGSGGRHHSDRFAARSATAGRSSGERGAGTEGCGIRRPRRRQLPAGVVGAVCARRGQRRTGVLLLSAIAGSVGGGRDGDGAGQRTECNPAARGVRSHGRDGCERRPDGGVLSLLRPRSGSAGVLINDMQAALLRNDYGNIRSEINERGERFAPVCLGCGRRG